MNKTSDNRVFARSELPDHEIEEQMIRALDAELGHPPRLQLGVGTVLFQQEQPLEHVWILESGKVKLFRVLDGQEVIFHSQTVGRIIGLLAFTSKQRAFFSCKAASPVTLVKVSFEELEAAMNRSEALTKLFIMVILRSMARRNRRAIELQTEIHQLNHSLAGERDQLQRALLELHQAQALLVESGKMATLGQMAAGIAHELNNPIGAIVRAADFIGSDLNLLGASLPDGSVFLEMIDRTLNRPPLSTREQRVYRARLEEELGHADLAKRLSELGIRDAAEFRQMTARLQVSAPEAAIVRLELFHQVAASLRNIQRCAGRIADLVHSLRNYSRSDELVEGINIHDGLEDTLLLLANRLHDVEVEKAYEATRRITALPGPLNQVWTNMLSNALDAMHDKGRILLATRDEGADAIAVSIVDSGPGIPAEHQARVFDLQFTTRKGRVDFGLGLGLAICRNIVTRHGGRIEIHSEPGRTEFRVILPVTPADAHPLQKENMP